MTNDQAYAAGRAMRHGWDVGEPIGDVVMLYRGSFAIAVHTDGRVEVA